MQGRLAVSATGAARPRISVHTRTAPQQPPSRIHGQRAATPTNPLRPHPRRMSAPCGTRQPPCVVAKCERVVRSEDVTAGMKRGR